MDKESELEVRPGELFAIACADPSDSDALAARLARFEDSGRPELGGVPLADLPLDQVRQRILLSRNSDRFFSGTLRGELDPSGERGDDEILAAIAAASAEDVLESLPEGLDAEVVDGGRTFSGGQLQRLRLVRALLARREITLLVEPTSAVDAHTEARIAEHLAEAHAPGTEKPAATVLFTTSPLLLDRAHRVAYIEDGHAVAVGAHRELLATVPRYASVVTRGEDLEDAA